jgi:septum formation protein
MAQRPTLILASASPARRNLLAAAGIDAAVIVSGVDEDAVEATTPEALCAVLARMKAHAVAERLRHSSEADPHSLVLGCDSVLAIGGRILGKPSDLEEARNRWEAMRGRSGVLHTGHCLIDLATGKTAERVGSTVVHFAEVTEDEIDLYVATGEPLWVAGAFTLDGMSAPFVDRIEGDPGNVIGLSLPLLRHLLLEIDRQITDLWRQV